MASRSKDFIDYLNENSEEITLAGIIIAIICFALYHLFLVKVNPGEYYIDDYSGKQVENGLRFRPNVTEVDTSAQFCAICCLKDNPRKYTIDTYKKSSPYLHFRLKGENVIATVVVTYNNTIDRYYPTDRSDDQFVADFMAVVQNLEQEYSFDDVNRNREAFCKRIVDDFNRTNTCGRIIQNIKLLDFKVYIAEAISNCEEIQNISTDSKQNVTDTPDIPQDTQRSALYCTETDSISASRNTDPTMPDHLLQPTSFQIPFDSINASNSR